MSASECPASAIVIPARYASTRFPGKPLLKLTGKFLIQHVVEQAQKSRRAQAVLVATDDHRIYDAVHSFGGRAVMTSSSHQSGTDRIAEVMKRPEFLNTQIVVNVQGDEPDIDPALIDTLIEALEKSDIPMATASAPFAHEADVGKPNFVKVVTDCRGHALYFSRAIIPFDRDRNGTTLGLDMSAYRKHLGIYAYRREALLKLAAAPMCSLERIEKLEQLRALYLGMAIFVAPVAHAPHGVDTPDDYAAFVRRHHESAGTGKGAAPIPPGGSKM